MNLAKVSQRFSQKLLSKHVAPVCWNLSALGSKSLQTRRCKTCLIPEDLLSHINVPMVSFITVFIVAVSFLRIPFTIICACMEAGRRNKPSIGIKALPIFWSSGQR